MSNSDENAFLAARVRTMQLILVAMLMGCVTFMGIALFWRQANGNAPAAGPIITYVALAFAVMALTGSLLMSSLATASGRRKLAQQSGPAKTGSAYADPTSDDKRKLLELMATVFIIAAAPLEGGIFFLLISYMVEGSFLAIVGALILLAVLASKFPTQQRTERWLELQQELLQQERMAT
jgi:hypothetical protein